MMTLHLEETLQWMAILVWGPILFLCLVHKYNDWLGTSNAREQAAIVMLKLIDELKFPLDNLIVYYSGDEKQFVLAYVEDCNKARQHDTRLVFNKFKQILDCMELYAKPMLLEPDLQNIYSSLSEMSEAIHQLQEALKEHPDGLSYDMTIDKPLRDQVLSLYKRIQLCMIHSKRDLDKYQDETSD